MKKKGLLIALLLMAVGFAAVTTTLVINSTSILKKNTDDFKVYYSDALVNGTQDLSVVVDDTHLSFKTTLDTLGQTYVLDYDVTNSSKNYDAKLKMNCTGGNEWLTVVNTFNTTDNLLATDTRSGKLTLTLAKSYTGSDLDVEIECTIDADAIERNSLGIGEANPPVEKPATAWIYIDADSSGDISVGDVYALKSNENEKFNVISHTEDTVTMLAAYCLGEDYRQTDSRSGFEYEVSFSNLNGWEYTPGPKEIDIQVYDGNVKTYVNEYVSYLERETGNDISGNLITLTELKSLGCTINDNYESTEGLTCENSQYFNWLANLQSWWTRSADAYNINYVYYVDFMYTDLGTSFSGYANGGVRPVITISKDDL